MAGTVADENMVRDALEARDPAGVLDDGSTNRRHVKDT